MAGVGGQLRTQGFLAQGHTINRVHLKDKLWTDWLTGFVVRGILLIYDKPIYLETNVPNLSSIHPLAIVCPTAADALPI